MDNSLFKSCKSADKTCSKTLRTVKRKMLKKKKYKNTFTFIEVKKEKLNALTMTKTNTCKSCTSEM